MRPGKIAVTLLAAWLIPTISLPVWMMATPNALVREASAGSVVTVTTHHSWNPMADRTTLHTTLGTFEIEGLHSAPRGQPLVIQDTTRDGEQLCIKGAPGTCVPFSGSYLGALPSVPHAPVLLTHAVRTNLWVFTGFWGIAGGIVFAVFLMFWVVEWAGGCDADHLGNGDVSHP